MKSLYVEPTNVCNQKCSFCFQSTGDMTRKKGMMSEKTFDKVLVDAKGEYDELVMHHSGESMLHPKIISMVKKAKSCGYRVSMTTNGTVPLAPLLENADHVTISLGEKRHANVVVSTVGDWATLLPREKMSWGGVVPTPSTLKSFLRPWFFKLKLLLHMPICESIDGAPAVLWDGTVVPCCVDFNADLKLGNIADKPLVDIIDSADWIRDGLSGRATIPEKCKRCKL